MRKLRFSLLLLLVITVSGFKSYEATYNYKSYYYVSATILKHDKSINQFVRTGEVYISSLQVKNHSKACGFNKYDLSKQFREFIDANYNVQYNNVEGRIFSVNVFSKKDAIKYYNQTKKLYNKVKTLNNFEYYCDDE